MFSLRVLTVWFASAICILSSAAMADVVDWFTDREEWESAVGEFTTIDFTKYPHGTPLTDQYAHLGAVFSGNAFFHHSSIFLNDGAGMAASGGAWVDFHSYKEWIAADFVSLLAFALYDGDDLILEISFSGSGLGVFAGLISEKPFNRVYLFRPAPFDNLIAIDDLHFGALAVPAPGALALFGLAFVGKRRRRLP